MKFVFNLISILFMTSIFLGCATEEKNLSTAEGSYKYAKELDDAERFELALTKYADVKNKFPYSNLATEAELAIAEVHYKRESFAEAQISFQNFRDLHPRHPKIDYVIYKIAMSYYMQLPDTFDRDLSLGNDAIYHFDELIKSYPHSEYVKEAREKRAETFEKLTEKELYVADFYFKQKKYSAALRRYESTIKKYTSLGFDPRAHLGAARSAKFLDDSTKRKYHVGILMDKYPQSNEASIAKAEEL
jgi:outer membrane protein assembly factor BamD